MSGTTTNTNATNNYDAIIFTGQKSEFGMRVFSDPHRQATYNHFEEEYKKKHMLKEAYDKQEFLRKMRTDIKREYLTRKKQIKRLQRTAAIDFRNAEMSLQEHYATSAEGYEPWRIQGVDINAPLVSQIQLPGGETLDLKTLQCHAEFDKLREIHEDLRLDQFDSIMIQEEEQQQREFERGAAADANEASWGHGEWWNQTPPTPASLQTRGAFGGCYDDNDDNDDNDSTSSYDSSYCAEFGYYPREYNYERQMREDEEARVAQAERLRAEHAAEAAAEDEAEARLQQQNKRPSHLPGCSNPRCVSCCWDDDRGYNNTWSDAESEPEEEHNIMEIHDDCPPIHDEPTPASTGGGSTTNKANKAMKKSSSHNNAAAAKARIAKQQKKKQQQQKKYVPLQLTDNTNRTNEVTAILTANKLEINLPKKKLLNATREAKKRYNQKWNHTNTECKQSAARGT
jgi:hypothetical protein